MTSTSNELVQKIRHAATELEMNEVIEKSLSFSGNYDKVKFTTLTIISLRGHQTAQLDSDICFMPSNHMVKSITELLQHEA